MTTGHDCRTGEMGQKREKSAGLDSLKAEGMDEFSIVGLAITARHVGSFTAASKQSVQKGSKYIVIMQWWRSYMLAMSRFLYELLKRKCVERLVRAF